MDTGIAKSADSKGADAQRSGEDRKQRRSSDGTRAESQKNSSGAAATRPGATHTSKSHTVIDLDDEDSDQAGGNKLNKSNAAKEPTADASKTIKHNNNSICSDSNRDERGQANQNQGDHKG